MKLSVLTCLLLLISCNPNQIDNLNKLIRHRKPSNHPHSESWGVTLDVADDSLPPVYVGPQDGLKEANKIDALPGDSIEGANFDQYAGYVTVDPQAGRALFYYFVESPQNSSTKPLVPWLNGGPGCSSFGYGAMEELGPYRVNSDKKTLFRNRYAWNNAANVIFLESPAGVGFSYSNTTSDYTTVGDKKATEDAYTFLVNWLERFPEYKTRDFFITRESYTGHYVPELAYTILQHNKATNGTKINLKGIAIGNAWIDNEQDGAMATYDYLWARALNSDETNAGIHKHCTNISISQGNSSDPCFKYMDRSDQEMGDAKLNSYNIYAPVCETSEFETSPIGSVGNFDPCSDDYVKAYLNVPAVQSALHVKPTNWTHCGDFFEWTDEPETMLPTIKQLIESGMNIWLYSGDADSVVPVSYTRASINKLKLQVKTPLRPWMFSGGKVGGYVIGYKGLTFATVRGAGHMVPTDQPQRALILISSFLDGKLPPLS